MNLDAFARKIEALGERVEAVGRSAGKALAAQDAILYEALEQLSTDVRALRATEEELVESKRRYEDALHLVVTGAGGIIYHLDRELRCTWVADPAPPFAKERMLGKTLLDLLEPEDAERAAAICWRVLANGAGERLELGLRLAGVERWFEVAVQLWRDAAGQAVGLAVYSRETTERRRAEQALRESQYRLAQLEERNRIAMDLHDEFIQSLYAVVLGLSGLEQQLVDEDSAVREAVGRARSEIGAAIQRMRDYAHGLRGQLGDEASLRRGLEALVEEVGSGGLVRAELALEVDVEGLLDPDTVANLLSVAREATSNAVRHGAAGVVTIRLAEADGQLALMVYDNGRGFNPRRAASGPGQGLRNMAERARALGGHLTIASRRGRGTTVRLEMPFPRGGAAAA